jgi:predicted Zn-dependent protease
LLRRARALAQVIHSPPDPPAAPTGDPEGWDDDLATLPCSELCGLARQLLQVVREASAALVVETLLLTADTCETLSWPGPTVARTEREARLSWAVSLMKRTGNGATSLFELTGCGGNWQSARTRLKRDVQGLALQLAATDGIRPLSDGDAYEVFLTPPAVVDLVVPYLVAQLSGAQLAQGQSWLRLGAAEGGLSPLLSVSDEPRSLDFIRACVRDREGTPTRTQALVTGGIPVTPIADRKAATALGVDAPGLAGGPFGIVIDPGDLHEEELRAGGSQILCLGRFTGAVDPASGRFWGVAKCSRLLCPGAQDTFIEDFPVTGDLRVLLSSVTRLGATRELVRGEVLCPGVLAGAGIDC